MAGLKDANFPLMKGDMKKVFEGQIPVHLALILCQILSSIYYVVSQVALNNGFSPMVLSLYRNLLAMLTLAPIAYFMDKGNRVVFSWTVGSQLALLGFTGIFGSNLLLFLGIRYTSAEFSSGLQPAAPVATAIIAVVFGVEQVLWQTRHGQAQVLGVIFCCTGAVIMTFWHGPEIFQFTTLNALGDGPTLDNSMNALQHSTLTDVWKMVTGWRPTQWQIGFACLLANSSFTGAYLNLQSPFLKKFPAPVSVLTYAYFFGTLFMGITCAISIRDPSEYALGWDVSSAVVLYNGLVASALNYVCMSWSLTRVGPLFVASYFNLQPPITVILSVISLGATLDLGSIIGTILILLGLVLSSWALSREELIRQVSLDLPRSQGDSSSREPLLKA